MLKSAKNEEGHSWCCTEQPPGEESLPTNHTDVEEAIKQT